MPQVDSSLSQVCRSARMAGALAAAAAIAFVGARGEGLGRDALVWDATAKEYHAKPGELEATFSFRVKNRAAEPVDILAIRTSCGCTVAKLDPLPDKPYRLEANASVSIGVVLDLRGKIGKITKEVTVESSAGATSLMVSAMAVESTTLPGVADLPLSGVDPSRATNIQTALADRHAIFRGECATCHVAPGVGKTGGELYTAVCGICHESPQRAALVPDLTSSRAARSVSFWYKWIAEGKQGGMMPPFSQALGGPLTNAQLDSLIAYLVTTFPARSHTAVPVAR